jgi:hypothetical protein
MFIKFISMVPDDTLNIILFFSLEAWGALKLPSTMPKYCGPQRFDLHVPANHFCSNARRGEVSLQYISAGCLRRTIAFHTLWCFAGQEHALVLSMLFITKETERSE